MLCLPPLKLPHLPSGILGLGAGAYSKVSHWLYRSLKTCQLAWFQLWWQPWEVIWYCRLAFTTLMNKRDPLAKPVATSTEDVQKPDSDPLAICNSEFGRSGKSFYPSFRPCHVQWQWQWQNQDTMQIYSVWSSQFSPPMFLFYGQSIVLPTLLAAGTLESEW